MISAGISEREVDAVHLTVKECSRRGVTVRTHLHRCASTIQTHLSVAFFVILASS
jgi:hypothetical protein